METAKHMATATYLLTTGELTSVLQQSIAIAGRNQNQERVATLAIEFLNRGLQQLAFSEGAQQQANAGIRVPRPHEVFE